MLSLPKGGTPRLPSLDKEGWGWCDFATLASFAPWPETVIMPKMAEQSENVYENKGTAQKSTTPRPSLCKEGNSWAPLLG